MIEFTETIKLAIAGITSNKFRSFLTLLGIIIGTGAVILMISLGSATQKIVTGQFNEVVKRQIFIGPNYDLPYQQRGKLKLEDEEYLTQSIKEIKQIVAFNNFRDNIKYNNQSRKEDISPAVGETMPLTNLKLKYGRPITEEDNKSQARVAVIGERVIEKLVNLTDYSTVLGNHLYIGGRKFLIVGILAKSGSTVGLDHNRVLIPYSTAQESWQRRMRYVDYYLASYSSSITEKDIRAQVKYLLDKKYGTTATNKSKFRLQGLAGQLNIMTKVLRVFTYLLGGVAAISLLVGGIGIMNIMLVTVKERTREIGIRLAIGATRRDIQQQFLVETVILSLGGGVLGVLSGSLFSTVVNFALQQAFNWWQGVIPLWSIVVSFLVTVLIGVIFGFYPAYKASQLDPVDALRYE